MLEETNYNEEGEEMKDDVGNEGIVKKEEIAEKTDDRVLCQFRGKTDKNYDGQDDTVAPKSFNLPLVFSPSNICNGKTDVRN